MSNLSRPSTASLPPDEPPAAASPEGSRGRGEAVHFGIGALSEATGVPAPTLRTWERRYGFPVAARTACGQRVYAPEVVEHVRLAARAMDLGHRPAAVFRASVEHLRSLVGSAPPVVVSLPPMNGAAIEAELRHGVAEEGLWGFLQRRVVPLLTEVGEACADGRLTIYEEHLFSERLREFLAGAWRPLADTNRGPVGVCATLPGEQHGLGLHLAACALALEGWRVAFLGVDLPLTQIADGTRSSGGDALFLSVSTVGAAAAARQVGPLRELLPAAVPLVLGGAGAPTAPGVVTLTSLDALRAWLHARV